MSGVFLEFHMPIPSSWVAQTDRMNRASKAKVRKQARTEPLEKHIQTAILDALRLNRIQIIPTDAGGTGDVKGLLARFPAWLRKALGLPQDLPFGLSLWLHIPKDFPDLLGQVSGGRWIAVEVKRPGQKPRPGQLAYLELFRQHGAIAFWASSADDALAQLSEQTRSAA